MSASPHSEWPCAAGRSAHPSSLAAAVWSLLLVAALLAGRPGEVAAQAPAPPASAAIPMAEIAARAAEESNLLRSLSLIPSPEVETIRAHLPELRNQIDLELEASNSILRGQPTLDMLQAQQQLWQRMRLTTNQWLGVLTQRATLLQTALTRLGEIRRTWRETRAAAAVSGAPGTLLAQIDDVLAAVDAAQAPLEARRTNVLDLLSVVAREVARAEAMLAQFTQAQESAVGGILARESPPLWSAQAWRQAHTALAVRVRGAVAARWADIVRYLRSPAEEMPLHLACLALLAAAVIAARRRVWHWARTPEGTSPATAVFERPFATTVAIALLIVAAPISPFPPTVRKLLVILGLGPVIRLTRLTADPRLAPDLYLLWILFAIDSLREAIAGAPAIEQAVLGLEMLAGIAALTYSLTAGGLRRLPSSAARTGRLGAYRVCARLVLLLFVVALGASTLGYMRLARLLASGVLGSSALALMLYATLQALVGVAAVLLRVWPLRTLQMVQHHRDLFERRARGILGWLAIGAWVIRLLDYVGLFQLAVSFGETVLGAKLGRGAIRISIGDILEFVLTVWLAYLTSTFIRFVLQEDVYPRTRMTRGISYAISSLLNYVIIALGFVVALGALGLNLDKVSVLAGAFGVGIGFGLQSVVNNFVSGLILLFERPVHVGDVVEIGDHLSGEVSRIGIRASTVRTWQGAEIIVPNAQFITERVTNWTLSDRTRRIDLPVGVDYGSAPEKVVEVLEGVARAHPEIMQTPPPQAVFLAFGDSSINFELRAWTNRFERWARIRTDLAAATYAALHEAGMSLPFPQREVRLLPDALTRPTLPSSAPSDPGSTAGATRPPE